MKYFYSLQIKLKPSFETYESITKILELIPSERIPFSEEELKSGPVIWLHEVEEIAEDSYFDFITYYSDIIAVKSEALANLGIEKDAISVWLLYAYKGQCILEFDPTRLKKLADNGMSLCISCWEDG